MKLQDVVLVEKGTETAGRMKNGRVVEATVWSVYICTLACGHKAKRRADSPTSPAKLKCPKGC